MADTETTTTVTPERLQLRVIQDQADGLKPGEAPRWEIWLPAAGLGEQRVCIGPLDSMPWALRMLALGQLATEHGVTANDVAARVARIMGDQPQPEGLTQHGSDSSNAGN